MSKEVKDKQARQEKEEKRARKEAKREKKRLAEEASTVVAEPIQPVKEADTKISRESKKSKKRKLEDEAVEEPKEKKKSKKVKADDQAMEDAIVARAKSVEDVKKPKKSKKSKNEDKPVAEAVVAGNVEEPKKPKKSKKRKSEGETEKPTNVTNGISGSDNDVSVAELKALKKKAKRDGKASKGVLDTISGEPKADEDEEDAEAPVKKNQRFIVFIGNLPYTATEESIKQHFIKIRPTSIRPRKGYAFMDFDHYDRMKTCLSLYHHSSFDDGTSPAREINVELTVGGGGNSANRKTKLDAKNERLGEQRERRKIEEQRQKDEGETKGSRPKPGKKTEKLVEKKTEAASAEKPAKPEAEAHTGIHPSRLGRLLF